MNTDTPLPPEEPAGQNPPDGAIINFLLKQNAQQVTLEVLTPAGAVIRRYSSDDAPERMLEGVNVPPYWVRPPQIIDGYVFVTPEYNHGISGAFKNAIDFLFREWNNKAAGFVSYGGAGGARAVEQLRLMMAEVQIATVRNQVMLSLFTDFENYSVFKPGPALASR